MNIIEYLKSEGYYEIREIPGIGVCGLRKFIFTTGLVIGMDENLYYGRYCYAKESDASKALKEWDGKGDPSGPWIKYKGSPEERSNPLMEEGCLNCNATKI
jgi:hypothetical protein